MVFGCYVCLHFAGKWPVRVAMPGVIAMRLYLYMFIFLALGPDAGMLRIGNQAL